MKNKNKVKGKPKYPLFKSLGEIILLILFIAIFPILANEVFCTLFTNDIRNILSEIIYHACIVIGIGGSILILVDNLAGKQIIKNIFRKIWKFYRNFKVYWKQHVAILIVLSGIIIYSQIVNYNNSIKLCGSDGYIYYCKNGEDVACEGDLVPVYDKKNYKCISKDTYLHDYEHKEYTYICTNKYVDEKDSEHNKELMSAEKECLYNELKKEAEPIIADIKKDLPSSYDVRNKVTIKAGNQGNSYTCSLWSETKALEISAQLKGIDYQFLLDFEKQINNIKIFSPFTDGTSENLCYYDECIPGKKKYISISEFELTSNDDTLDYKVYPEFSSKFKEYQYKYLSLFVNDDKYNDLNVLLNSDEYFNMMAKFIIMKYGSVSISSTDENKYIDPAIGHGMIIIGWNDSKKSWLVLNSWGDTWDDTPGNGKLKSNGDGTTWIKFSDKGWSIGGTTELLGP